VRRLALPRAWFPAALAALLLATLAFYVWTAATSGDMGLYHGRIDPYNAMATAFVHGHLDLPLHVPRQLLALPDPYSPQARGPYVTSDLSDLSLFHGKLYAYWGPAPALLLFVPFRALGLGDLPPGVAVIVLAFGGLLASVALLRFLVGRFLPRTPRWAQLVAVAVLATCNAAPWLLRRPAQYEVAISGAYCFTWLALLLVLTGGLRDRPSRWRLALGSLCVGIALASRPPLALTIVVPAALLAVWWRRDRTGPRRSLAPLAVAALGPFVLVGIALAVYNHARFGSFTDFGQRWQLAGSDQTKKAFFDPAYLPAGLWDYLVAPARLRVAFPFFYLPPPPRPPFPYPAGYENVEPTSGMLANLPFLWLLLAAPFGLRGRPAALRAVVWGGVAIAAALVVFLAMVLWSTTNRYEMDFATFLLIPSALAWFAALGRARRRRARRVLQTAGVVLASAAMVVAVAVSFVGEKGLLQNLHPGTFAALQRFFGPVSTAMASIAGHPIIASANGDATLGPWRYDRLGVSGADFDPGPGPTIIQVVSPRREVIRLSAQLVSGGVARRLIPTITAPGVGSAVGRTVDGGMQRFDLPVHQGLNDLVMTVASVPPIGPADPRRVQLLAVHDLQLTELRR
jgi:hypothetical protein